MISYKPLWEKLYDNKMTGTELREKANITTKTLARINKNEYISMKSIENICKALKCRIEDVIKII